MGTIVAVETDGGAAIAGDGRVTRGGTVTSETATRVFDLDGVGAGAVGEPGDVDAFARRLEAALEEAEYERGRELTVDVLARMAARVAAEAGVQAVVAARDGDGVARIRQVDADGGVLSDPVAALGSGAGPALGRLEAADRDRDLESTEEFVRDVLETVAERDADTGEAVDSWSLASEGATD